MMVLSLLTAMPMFAEEVTTGQTTQVEGTQLATLHSIMDVLMQMTGIECGDNGIYVTGRGQAEVYLNNRKVTDITELWHTQASNIVSVSVIQQPGVEYGKEVRAVILVKVKEVKNDGFSLDNHLRFDLTNKLSTNEELNLGFKKNKLNIRGLAAWNEQRSTVLERPIAFTYAEKTHMPTGAQFTTQHTTSKVQQLTARFNADYDFTPCHRLSLGYTFLRLPRAITRYDDQSTTSYGVLDGKVNYDAPTVSHSTMDANSPETRHTMNVEYRGFLQKWTLFAGNNTYWDRNKTRDERPAYVNHKLTDEVYSRSYIRAEMPAANGTLRLGTEYNYNDVNLKNEYTNTPKDLIHVSNTNHVLALYTSLDQQIGDWTLSAGVRYEHEELLYKPFDDDVVGMAASFTHGIMGGDMSKMPGWEQTVTGNLIAYGHYKRHGNYLAPTVSIGTRIKDSQLTLSYAQTYQRPSLALITIASGEVSDSEDKILRTERQSTAMLAWQWKWIGAEATYNQYTDPLCNDSYNGPSYDALQFKLTLSPTIGKIWKPAFMAQLQKQWFDMQLANGKHKLNTPVLTLQFNNTITLPHNWMIRLNADWHSRGHERNIYYYSANLELDAAVQKVFPRQHLTIELLGDNLLRDSWTDITNYARASSLSSDGSKVRKPRTVSLSVRYTL